MKIELYRGPGDGAVIDVLDPARQTFEWRNGGGVALYTRRVHCGHADCPVPFVLSTVPTPPPLG